MLILLIHTLHSNFEYFLPETIKFVLLMFKDSLFIANHVWSLPNSIDIFLLNSSRLLPVQNILVSLANIIKSRTLEILQISLMCTI